MNHCHQHSLHKLNCLMTTNCPYLIVSKNQNFSIYLSNCLLKLSSFYIVGIFVWKKEVFFFFFLFFFYNNKFKSKLFRVSFFLSFIPLVLSNFSYPRFPFLWDFHHCSQWGWSAIQRFRREWSREVLDESFSIKSSPQASDGLGSSIVLVVRCRCGDLLPWVNCFPLSYSIRWSGCFTWGKDLTADFFYINSLFLFFSFNFVLK